MKNISSFVEVYLLLELKIKTASAGLDLRPRIKLNFFCLRLEPNFNLSPMAIFKRGVLID
jgi:hypothetical protein